MNKFYPKLFTIIALVMGAGYVLLYAGAKYERYQSGLEVLTARDRAELHYYYGCAHGHNLVGKFTVGDVDTKHSVKLLLYRARKLQKPPLGTECLHTFKD